ncbi:hypothetical protein KGG73_gp42 [Streptomyces phage Sentinel]|uniref:Uncharacterized protein n=1 Tax=Streptomyces phage Sentinel TaxID=2767584 RepID=A0A873WK49_9CAUD|nr:hypothetical protein KGG73_gp42 [Streptomyces phage Sentinel]QPB09876.1 hypothetical protein CPT_Sentinel_042 [Streptomyces phage Sentinel]
MSVPELEGADDPGPDIHAPQEGGSRRTGNDQRGAADLADHEGSDAAEDDRDQETECVRDELLLVGTH